MKINSILKKILGICMFGVILMGISSCGGSTSGTGGVTVEGRLVELNNVPLGSAQITILQSGESTVSDSQGNFKINTPFASVLELLIEDSNFSVQSKVENIPQDAVTVVIVITVNRKDRSATSETKEIRQREREDSSSDDKSNENDNSGKGGGSSSNDDKGSQGDSDAGSDDKGKGDSNSGSGGDNKDDSPNDNSTDKGDKDKSDDDSGEDNSNSSDGKEYRQEGLISSISSSSITVGGVTFIPTSKSEYRDRDGKKTMLAAFSTGMSVKAEGKVRNGIIELYKLEEEEEKD